MFFYSLPFILAVVCAVFYYRASGFEGASSLVWSGISILTSLVILFWLQGGFLAVLLGQAGVFVAITLYRSRGTRIDPD